MASAQKRSATFDRPLIIWLALLAASFASWALGLEEGRSSRIGVFVITIAFAKVWLVGLYFMELRHAPAGLRAAFQGYVVFCYAVLIGLYCW